MASAVTRKASTSEMLLRAKRAASEVARLSTSQKNAILRAMGERVAANHEEILAANRVDLDNPDLRSSSRDRLLLNPKRISEMVEGIQAVVSLPDPVGNVVEEWT